MKKIIWVLIFTLLISGCTVYDVGENVSNNGNESLVDERETYYTECLNSEYSNKFLTSELESAILELDTYLGENYSTSIFYEDINTGFTYSYNPDVVYYAASTIKLLAALYIYEQASLGLIDLDDTLTYLVSYKASEGMSNYELGTEVDIRTLVRYTIVYSDNSAYQMLIKYIGKSTLKEYGNSLGATQTMIGSDNFGCIDTTDAYIYVKALHNFITSNEEYGEELQSYFLNASQNDLEMDGITAAHKYGEYGIYYHDIGIVYADNPYIAVILTMEGNGDFETIVKDINAHIYELHLEYYKVREEVCYAEVYN